MLLFLNLHTIQARSQGPGPPYSCRSWCLIRHGALSRIQHIGIEPHSYKDAHCWCCFALLARECIVASSMPQCTGADINA